MKYRTLIDTGDEMPLVGYGTFTLKGEDCHEGTKMALETGYRHIDTAEAYNNQKEVAVAVKESGIPREELFITSKVASGHLKYDQVLKACDETLEELQTDYLDLYLIHWPNFKDATMEETFKAMTELKQKGKIRNIGVSNFTVNHLKDAQTVSSEPIAVNQVEFHPFLNQRQLLNFCDLQNIVITAHSPVARGKVLENEILQSMEKPDDKSLVQLILKWLVEKGIVVIPRSSSREHLKSNLDLFDWDLPDDVRRAIETVPEEFRIAHPAHFNPNYQRQYTD